ncbi:opacity protein-like surface antigen [Vibrio sp. ES.051]|nr:opacity protein-like surface antigen [Vibrio sp. ES.051]
MKIKNIFSLAVLTFFITNAAVADTKTGFYLGTDVAFANDTELENSGASIEKSNDVGFSAVVGYESDIEESFKLAGEVEYRTFGEVDFFGVMQADGHAIFVNLKPKYTFDTGVYIAGVLGLGQMTLKDKTNDTQYTVEESETGYQFGVESGYNINESISLNVGYRSANTEIDDVKIAIRGLYVGGRYYF